MTGNARRVGFSLLELIAALIIAATLAALSLHHLREPAQTGKQRSCDLTREVLQDHADRYLEANGRLPQSDLRELATTQYSGNDLPVCPVTGLSYRLDRNGVVTCPTHEPSR